MLTLDVLIATYMPEGILRVADMDLPVVDGVCYIVSWQQHGDAPVPEVLASRTDMLIDRFGQKGVSLNRNNAIELATADILLMADDDLRYTPDRLRAVVETFEKNPDVDYASFMYEGEHKTYPSEACDLTGNLPKGFYQTTFEVAVRRDSPAGKLRFHAAFGPGAPIFHSGEDEMFLLTALRLGIRCRFFPIVITTHNGPTTGNRPITDPKVLQGMGAFIFYLYPFTFIPRIPLKAWRLARAGQAPFFKALYELASGVIMGYYDATPFWREARR